MSKLLVKKQAGTGRIAHVTPENAGWTYVGFDLHKLKSGDTVSAQTGGREVCLVLVSGKADISRRRQGFRRDRRAHEPLRGQAVVGLCPGEIELDGHRRHRCRARRLLGARPRRRSAGSPDRARRSRPGNARQGHQHALRHQHPAGRRSRRIRCSSSRSSRRAATPRATRRTSTTATTCPRESYLEETYYHRLNPPQGFAFQRVYTDADASGSANSTRSWRSRTATW